ncbi:hypothetical protein [Arthrobacter sp. L77]|uniref:hypothetical protein n=1 Tax=Arthrobacter sp. L77 TaxID=1496689 RepID=UPI000691D274|nr:hypothetical protein [Arthrobacter sp. L77]
MTESSLTLHEVYLHYLNSGGFFDEFEMDAYLHGLTPLPREERDCIAQAVNELIDDLLASGVRGRPSRASYSRAPEPLHSPQPARGTPSTGHAGRHGTGPTRRA